MVKFMPAEFKLTETRQPPLKDEYDEWLAWVICYALSMLASAFVNQAIAQRRRRYACKATQEGPIPLKAWVTRLSSARRDARYAPAFNESAGRQTG
jgi:hypothetical protein